MEYRSRDRKPARPGVYAVEVLMRDPVTHEPIGTVQRWARWTGLWWTCWAMTPEGASRCEWRGPLGGYPWSEQASTIQAGPRTLGAPCSA